MLESSPTGSTRACSTPILSQLACAMTAISLASVGASAAFSMWWADAVAALGVAVIMLREGWRRLRLARSAA
jgi:divalent metal cation (Fe/Co/Zn/Cd) transporter